MTLKPTPTLLSLFNISLATADDDEDDDEEEEDDEEDEEEDEEDSAFCTVLTCICTMVSIFSMASSRLSSSLTTREPMYFRGR